MGKTILGMIFLVIGLGAQAQAGPPEHRSSRCDSVNLDQRSWNYCIYRYPNSSNTVAYFFHGLMADEREWQNYEKVVLKRWNDTQKRPPTVVSVSFGSAWFLAEKNASSNSGLFEYFTETALPYLQRQLGFTSEENILFGLSMGGFNAAQLYFKLPGFFSRAALICPAMATVSPHASSAEVKEYIRRTGAQSWRVHIALNLAKSYFPTETDWQRHSPIKMAEVLSPLSPPIYMSNGLKDEYGFHEGNLAFLQIAQDLGAPIESTFRPQGGHCHVDSLPIADFLVP